MIQSKSLKYRQGWRSSHETAFCKTSGEKDPEVYRAIQNKFSEQILEIWIRDIVNDREKNADRLDGMHVIPASTVEYRASELKLD